MQLAELIEETWSLEFFTLKCKQYLFIISEKGFDYFFRFGRFPEDSLLISLF